MKSQAVKVTTDKHGRTPLDLIPYVPQAFKRIKKGYGYHRRSLLSQKRKEAQRTEGRWRKDLTLLSSKIMSTGY